MLLSRPQLDTVSAPPAESHGPIFIGGLDRSGKTTMRAFLVSHPKISIPAIGSNMWTYFYCRYGDLRKSDNFERCLLAMLQYKHVKFLDPDTDRIRQEFRQGEPSYARLFKLFQQHHAEREGKPRWGDQTGLIERYADEVIAAYPEARIIHMIRDPRDRYQASLDLWPNGKGRVGGATARWLYSTRLAKRNRLRHPDSYMVVQFESLVSQTENTLRDVCRFIGEDYAPEMLEMGGAPKFKEKLLGRAGDDRHGPLLSENYIGGFRSTIDEPEMLFMQTIARREMQEFGYRPTRIQLSVRQKLSSALQVFPANVTRGVIWVLREAAQQKFPQLVPRPIAPQKRLSDSSMVKGSIRQEKVLAMDCRPIFIAGAERSGTSLMYALLASHPNVAMTRRTNFWPYFHNRFGDLSRDDNLERCLSLMRRYQRFRVLTLDFDRLRREFREGLATYGRLLALLEQQCAERTGKPRWGDKSLDTEFYTDAIFTEYPKAKIIHMVRHPADRYASAVSRWKVSRGRAGSGSAVWLRSTRVALHYQQRYPDNYMVLCYETLVSDPENTLRKICQFVGEHYKPSMISMQSTPEFRNSGGNSSYGSRKSGEITTASIGKFRSVMSNREILFMQTVTRRYMSKLGYPLDRIQLRPRDALQYYLFDFPINFALMVGKYIIESTYDRLGRKPSRRRLATEL